MVFEWIKMLANIPYHLRLGKRSILFYALLVSLILFSSTTYAQKKSNPSLSPINIDSLSADDKILFELYKDTFDIELQNFLVAFRRADLKLDTTISEIDKRSHVEIGVDFVSRVLINGREQGLNGVVFLPYVGYYHKTGLYALVTTNFYTDKAITQHATVPVTILSAGYQHNFFKIWSVGASYSRIFISYGSVVSRSLLNNTFTVNTGVNIWRRFIFEASFYIDWSSLRNRDAFEERAIGFATSLHKEFILRKFIGAKIFTISPGVTAYFATDNLAFVRQRAVAEQVHNPLSLYTTGIAHFFGFVDIEPSISFDWRIWNLDIFASAGVAIPFNTFNYNTNTRVDNPKVYSPYAGAGLKYLFAVERLKKHRDVKNQVGAFNQ